MISPAATASAITAAEVSMAFEDRRGRVDALERVSMRVDAGEMVCIVGPSGCGKSTLLRILAGLIEPTGGSVLLGARDGSAVRRTMVFQDHGLFPWMRIVDNVAFPLEAAGLAKPERRQRASELLEQLGLGAFEDRYPRELSGGMNQRAAIARALLSGPDVLLMDEPFSALDAQSKVVLQDELMGLWRKGGQTVVYVTHDITEAVVLGDRVMVMSGRPGSISMEIGVDLPRPRDVFDRDHPEVKEKAWIIWSAIEAQVRRNLHIPN